MNDKILKFGAMF